MHIVLVDDDQRVLQGVSRVIRRSRNPWLVDLALSGEEALGIIARHGCDVVVADVQMPGMGGPELLATIAHRHPHVVRFSLSAYSDRGVIMHAAGLSHQFLSKPCGFDVLSGVLARVERFRAMLTCERTACAVVSLEALCIQPTTSRRLADAVAASGAGVAEISPIVGADAGLAANILHLANWSVFSSGAAVGDIDRALGRIGLDVLRDLLLRTQIFGESDGLDPGASSVADVSRRGVRVSRRVRALAQEHGFGEAQAGHAAMAGLLQDIGKLVLIATRAEEYRTLCKDARNSGTPVEALEAEVFGADHATVGAALLVLWGVPYEIVDLVQNHHRPAIAPEGEAHRLLCMARDAQETAFWMDREDGP